jgi:hypothetical protein
LVALLGGGAGLVVGPVHVHRLQGEVHVQVVLVELDAADVVHVQLTVVDAVAVL